MSRYPGTIWDPSPNFRPGPTGKTRIVLHRMAGSYKGGLAWLKDPRSQVSAHFAVDDVSGEARQLVDTADVAWAEAAYNPTSVSIEIGGRPDDPVSASAWQSVVSIIRRANTLDGIPLWLASAAGDSGLSYHALLGVAGGDHPDCPGRVVIEARPRLLALAAGRWDDGGMLTSPADEARVTIRRFWVEVLGPGRVPSEAVLEQWVEYYVLGPAPAGLDAAYAALQSSPEGRAVAAARRARDGLGPVA